MDDAFPALREEPDGPFSRLASEIALRLAGSGADSIRTFEYPDIRAGRAVAETPPAAWEVAIQRTGRIGPNTIPPFESSRSVARLSGSIMTTVSGLGYAQAILERPTGLVITATRHSEGADLKSEMLDSLWASVDTPQFDTACD